MDENATAGPLRGSFQRCEWCGATDGFTVSELSCIKCGTPRGGEPDGRGRGEIAIKLHSLVGGGRSDLDGMYLASYNPRQPGASPDGNPLIADIRVTDDPGKALRFEDMLSARAEWMRWDGRDRWDGHPSRPLTAFNVEIAKPKGEDRWT